MKKPTNPAVLKSSDILNQTQRKSIGAGIWTGPRQRLDNEALPRTFCKCEHLTFSDIAMTPVRKGAEDHRMYKSRGM